MKIIGIKVKPQSKMQLSNSNTKLTMNAGGSSTSSAQAASGTSVTVQSKNDTPIRASGPTISQGWHRLDETDEISIHTGYAEYVIQNQEGDQLFTALLTYDERTCMFACSGCCKPDAAYIPHEKLYPNAPIMDYTRHPLNISGFGVQVYDAKNQDVFKFHRSPHDVKDISRDESMIVSFPTPSGGLLGKVSLPREKCGDFYEIYNSVGKLIYEIPSRVQSGPTGYLFDVIRRKDVTSFEDYEVVAMILIEGRHEVDVSVTGIKTTPAGDFHIQYREKLHTSEKAIILAAAFYIRIREFSSYIPMVEAIAAAKIIVAKDK